MAGTAFPAGFFNAEYVLAIQRSLGLVMTTSRSLGAPWQQSSEARQRRRRRRPAHGSARARRRPEPRGPDGTGKADGIAAADVSRAELEQLLVALNAARDGDFRLRLPVRGKGMAVELNRAFNELAERREALSKEIGRVGRVIGREGRMTERAATAGADGAWLETVTSLNTLIDDLVRPTTEVARVIDAVAQGDLSQKMALKIEGQPVKGEFQRIGTTVNAMVDQLSSFADEVTRVAREVGTDGQARRPGEGARRLGRVEGPDRQREHARREPHDARSATSPK